MNTAPAAPARYAADPAGPALYVVPCAADKLDRPAAARDLYTSPVFRHALNAAIEMAAADERDMEIPTRVMILSALHGLLDLDTIVAPYDVKMGKRTGIDAHALAGQIAAIDPGSISAMLPKAYHARIRAAAEYLNDAADEDRYIVQDVYDGCTGVGYQRGVASSMLRTADAEWDCSPATV